MASDYPYVITPASFQRFLGQIPTTGVPAKLTVKELRSMGYTSSNHPKMISVLRFIKFIDAHGVPTPRYKEFRDATKAKAVMAQALRETYRDLFQMYPDAQRKDDEALRNFFAGKTSLGAKAVSGMTSTFKTLASFADFLAAPAGSESQMLGEPTEEVRPQRQSFTPQVSGISPGIVINVQLQIPATSNADIYEGLFKALRKYVLNLTDET